MDLLRIYNLYTEENNNGERAAFEAAMLDKIEHEGYKMSDLLYAMFECQKLIDQLRIRVSILEVKGLDCDEKSSKRGK